MGLPIDILGSLIIEILMSTSTTNKHQTDLQN